MSGSLRCGDVRRWMRGAAILVGILAALGASVEQATADDAQIRLRILNRLKGQVDIDHRDLDVQVHSGDVELRGSVASLGELKRMDRLVYGVVGVKYVTNNLGIRPTNRSDQDIEERIRSDLSRRPRFRKHPVEVSVGGRVATLRGEVERALDRSDAAGIAEMVEGVVQVNNLIRVAASRETTPVEIRRRALAILTNPLTFGVVRNLEVDIDGATIVLRGEVPRLADKLEAGRLVQGVPGVVDVINRLEVRGS